MSKIEKFEVGQIYFQAEVLVNGSDVDGRVGDCFATREEAEADGESLVGDYDREWQKRNPGCVESNVREWKVKSVDEFGVCDWAETV
jgi:hypothetical protein